MKKSVAFRIVRSLLSNTFYVSICLAFFFFSTTNVYAQADNTIYNVSSTVNSISATYRGRNTCTGTLDYSIVYWYINGTLVSEETINLYWGAETFDVSLTYDCKHLAPNSTVMINVICYHYYKVFTGVFKYHSTQTAYIPLKTYQPVSNVQATDAISDYYVKITWEIDEKFDNQEYEVFADNNRVLLNGMEKRAGWTNCLYYCGPNKKFSFKVYGWVNGYRVEAPASNEGSTTAFRPVSNLQASDNKYDNKIVVTWNKSTTDVPYYKYRVYRDSELKATLESSADTWTDNKVEPGKPYIYSVSTIDGYGANWESIKVSDEGKAFNLNVQTESQPGGVKITWNGAQSLGINSYTGATKYKVRRKTADKTVDNEITTEELTIYNDIVGGDGKPIAGYNYYYSVQPYKTRTDGTLEYFTEREAHGKRQANGSITGTVKNSGGLAVPNVIIEAKLVGDPLPTDATTTYSGATNTKGEFTIKNIYYYTGAEFIVYPAPSNPQRVFKEPDTLTVSLNTAEYRKTDINFTDSSSYTASGKITQGTCPMDGVSLFFEDKDGVIDTGVKTDKDGEYTISIPYGGSWTIIPKLGEHEFTPDKRTEQVTGNVSDINFDDITKYTLDGYFTASCNTYIGVAKFEIFSPVDDGNCILESLTTNENGYFSMVLPARKYKMRLVDFTPDVDTDLQSKVLTYFGNDTTIDMTNKDNYLFHGDTLTFNLEYRLPPKLEIKGIDEVKTGINVNSDFSEVPLLVQDNIYKIEIRAIEEFDNIICPATETDGYVIIKENISSDSVGVITTDTLFYEKGQAMEYYLMPGAPNIISPYKKYFNATLYCGDQTYTVHYDVIVLGLKPREETFITVTPEIPFDILHDPPGDGSFSWLASSQSKSTSLSVSFLNDSTSTTDRTWHVMPTVSISSPPVYAGVSLCWEISGGWENTKTKSDGYLSSTDTTSVITTTLNKYFATSGNENVTGNDGDVYIGAALNMIYGYCDGLRYNSLKDSIELYTDLAMSPLGFNTTFVYSESFIVDNEIPRLEKLSNDFYSNGDNVRGAYMREQADAWKKIVEENHKNIKEAKYLDNKSFDGNTGGVEESITIDKTESFSFETAIILDTAIVNHFQYIAAGLGWSLNKTKITTSTTGIVRDSTISTSRTVGYFLDDDDAGDSFTIDIVEDAKYQTPAFRIVSGSSSCPWEKGTQPREGVQLTVDNDTQEVEEHEKAVFVLQLGNTSQSDETMTYDLIFDHASNPDGAKLTISGTTVGDDEFKYPIPAGKSVNATITVEKGPKDIYNYNGLKFILKSQCDDQIATHVLLNAVFYKNYDLTVAQVGEGTTIPSTGVTTYKNVTPVLLNAKPAAGYKFEKWVVGSAVYTDPTITIVMNASTTATAYFVENHFAPVWTGNGVNHMNINIFSAKIDGINLGTGDEIAVYDGNLCVGVGVLSEVLTPTTPLGIIVSQDDGSGNGYTTNNEVSYKFWDFSTSTELDVQNIQCVNEALMPASCSPFKPGFTSFVSLEALAIEKQRIELNTGWNIMSFRFMPENENMLEILQPLIYTNKLIKVMDESGATIDDWGIFGGWKNTIGKLRNTEGYKIKVTSPATIEVTGTPTPLPLVIPLNTGWNIISWPSQNEQDGIKVFQSIIDAGNLSKVMDEAGNTIENWGVFGGWRNGIYNFKPGEGYSVRVTSDCILTVNESGTKSEVIKPEILTSTHFIPAYKGNGTDHMNIHLVNLTESGIKPEDEIGVFDGNVCVGSAKVSNQSSSVSIAVSANDGIEEKNGFTVGNTIQMKLFRNGVEHPVNIEPLNGHGITFIKGSSLFAQLNLTTGTEGIPGSGFTEINCYPNPFREEMNIEIKLAKDSEVQVEVFNQLGQKVKIITKKQIMPGGLHKLNWNGRNENNSQVSPGIYHLRTKVDDSVIHKKVVLSK